MMDTIIRNAGRLRIKECDRIAAMQEELAKMGGTVKADGDTLTIEGCALHKPTAPLNGHNDHRIVMAMAVAALAAGRSSRGPTRSIKAGRISLRSSRAWGPM